jgi:hypothetical protein
LDLRASASSASGAQTKASAFVLKSCFMEADLGLSAHYSPEFVITPSVPLNGSALKSGKMAGWKPLKIEHHSQPAKHPERQKGWRSGCPAEPGSRPPTFFIKEKLIALEVAKD